MPAYDESYLDSMIQKTRYLFRLIGRNCKNPFEVITEYMSGDYRAKMDNGNPLYLNKPQKQILGNMNISIKASVASSKESFLPGRVYFFRHMGYNISRDKENLSSKE